MSALSNDIFPAEAPRAGGTAADEVGAKREAPSGRRSVRMPDVDGYRALAGVSIIVFHTWMQGGYPQPHAAFGILTRGSEIGVSLFFALSGLVLYLPMVRGALSGKAPNGFRFMTRRLYRILPLYYFLIIVVWSARYSGSSTDFSALLHHLTFTQVYDKDHIFWIIGPSWSLADEMHYYVLIALLGPPLAIWAARRKQVSTRLWAMVTMPAALLLASLAYTAYVNYARHIPLDDSWVYFNPLARADSFAEGMLLAVILSVPGVFKVRPSMASLLSGVGVSMAVGLFFARHYVAAIEPYFYALAGVPVLFLLGGAAMLHERQLLSRFLRSRPLQRWAGAGYSRYLWHEPIMLALVGWHVLYFYDPFAWLLSTLGLIIAASLVSGPSYRLIEQPGVRLQKLFDELRARQRRPAPPRPGPMPRWLPELSLRDANGSAVPLRDLPRDRPLLFAFDRDGGRRLAEQRFRLDSGEAIGFYVTATEPSHRPSGVTVLIDSEQKLETALNGAPGLLEVSPAGLITAVHEPLRGRHGARAQ